MNTLLKRAAIFYRNKGDLLCEVKSFSRHTLAGFKMNDEINDKKVTLINKEVFNTPVSMDQVRRTFNSYDGGSFELLKDNQSGIATLCINNPERRNALSGRMMVQMADLLSELENWKEV